jgi:hypothetical protein
MDKEHSETTVLEGKPGNSQKDYERAEDAKSFLIAKIVQVREIKSILYSKQT